MNEIILNNTLNKAKELLKMAKYSDNVYYRNGLSRQFHGCMRDYNSQLEDIGKDLFQKSTTDLRAEQYMYGLLRQFNFLTAKFYISISKKDTDSEVLKIKDKLQQKYGVKYLYCDNNADFANKCLSVAKILKRYKINMPKTIIGSDNYQKNSGVQFDIYKYGATIVLDTNYNSPIGITKSPFELIVHEVIHTLQKNILSLNQKKLPKEYDKLEKIHPDIYMDLQYKCNQEAHANLFTKRILSSLTKDEKKLLDYLNSLYI